MNIRHLLLLLLLFCTISTINAQNSELKSDEMIKKHFVEAEINNLEKIVEYFENYLKSMYQESEIENCYKNYFKYLANFERKGDLIIDIPKEIEIDMLKTLDDGFINEIWLNGTEVKNEERKKRFLIYNGKGKYLEFLANLATVNKEIKDYLEIYEAINDFSPSLIVGTIKSFENSRIDDMKVKLFIAIHYFSINRYK